MIHMISKIKAPIKLEEKKHLEEQGCRVYYIQSEEQDYFTVLQINHYDENLLEDLEQHYVSVQPNENFLLASRQLINSPTRISLKSGLQIGSSQLMIAAGPCAIESESQLLNLALQLKSSGANVIRGGAYKPRSSPYSFQGLGENGLIILQKASKLTGLPIITEVIDQDDIGLITEYVDILQVGARNCQNYALLKKLGKIDKPILLKRGLMATIEEFLLSSEYILSGGNMQVILCERGIRTFETETRNTLDISAIPVLKSKTHLPVVVDPSHAAGKRELVTPLSLAAIAAGADGLLIEVHQEPDKAWSDGRQSLNPELFTSLITKTSEIAAVMGRKI